ncbi:Isopenicillin N epimerase component 1 [Penicillium capsulatum]|uniref:Very long-chain fatty acid transport protein n=1 Tax=Penicillium capsulatum TaxID=69766 RepID=A0A9W9HTI4_9EURO|nr:Isopenicillin N epimerase component 1 [Penicillium capsulatum]KAJ6106592.1 Isopenicillin N epimerase component 1 [Penicillium capsulatum]
MVADIPWSMALPAAATAAAYLNARWGIYRDLGLIKNMITLRSLPEAAEKNDRLSLFYVLEDRARSPSTADREFIVYNGQSWTFRETYTTALRYGTWLKQTHGVQSKDIVAVDFMNSANYCFLILGLWSIGAIPALINYNLSGKPLTHSVRASTAKLLLIDEEVRNCFPQEQLDTFASAGFRDGKGPVEAIFFTPDVEAQILSTEPVREDNKARSGLVQRDMALLIYTSGTTGLPKPAVVSWKKSTGAAAFVGQWLGITISDRYFTVSFISETNPATITDHGTQAMPLYHSSATAMAFLPCLWHGGTVIIGRKFSARNFMREARENNATIIQYVGETLRYIMGAPPEIDPATGKSLDKKHNIRLAVGNGLRPDIWNRFKERFNIPTIAEFYAATEGASALWNRSSNDFSAGAIGHTGAIGSFLLGRSAAVVEVDHESQEPWRDPATGLCKQTPRGEPGELLYAIDASDPGAAFQGYFQNSKATESKILRDVLRKGDAYFRTGDMVRWDKEGRWYFSDRLGDTFRWKSENVSTNEVAEILGAHPEVHEANVYGVALPNHDGRAGCAAIVLNQQLASGSSSSAIEPSAALLESLASHVLKGLPRFAVPVFLRVMPEMQATGNFKQQKHVLRTEGVDISRVSKKDHLYWLQGNTYVPFEQKDWDRVNSGQARL